MSKTKLTVKTETGTFTRTTARTYSHLVVVKGYRCELLEARRLGEIKESLGYAADYEQRVITGIAPDIRRHNATAQAWDEECHAKNLASGDYTKWANQYRARARKLEADGPITVDDQNERFVALGWCGRLDLAAKLAVTEQANCYREVRIYAVDGTRVR